MEDIITPEALAEIDTIVSEYEAYQRAEFRKLEEERAAWIQTLLDADRRPASAKSVSLSLLA